MVLLLFLYLNRLEILKEKSSHGRGGMISKLSTTKNWIIDGKDSGICSEGQKGDKGDDGEPGKGEPEHLINSFVLGNPHESIFPAIYGAAEIKDVSALGIIESYDASSIIVAFPPVTLPPVWQKFRYLP